MDRKEVETEEKKHAISLENISFRYPGTEEKALDGVTCTFDRGNVYCLRGPNGSGKSTLFRILLGLDFPTAGHYFLEGEEVTERKMQNRGFSARLHSRIGYLFQETEVQLFTASVEEEISFGLLQKGLSRDEVREKTDAFIRAFDLDQVRHRAPFHLSGGEKKRTALAAVCAMEPDIFILDEPMAGLDEAGQDWMLDFIRREKKENRLFVIATHSRVFSDAVSDRVLYLNRYHRLEPEKQS